MSGWALESDSYESEYSGNNKSTIASTNNRSGSSSSKARHAFFADEDEDDSVPLREVGSTLKRRDSMTLVSSRWSNRSGRTEVVVVDSDEELMEGSSLKLPEHSRPMLMSSSKVDELAVPDIVVRHVQSTASVDPPIEQQYAHLLVREFLMHTYGNNVVTSFDKEKPTTPHSTLESVHTRMLLGRVDNVSMFSTKLEQLITVWDALTHQAQCSPHKTADASEPERSSSNKSSSSSSTKASCRKKPTLSVTISPGVPESSSGSKSSEDTVGLSEIDYNRLNHPGHTPKAHSALMSAVMGEPGSTPKASAGELRALGFSDVEEEIAPILTSPPRIGMGNSSIDLDMNSELSFYAQRKRAVRKHNKNVYIGETGRTPTKEYVFFRATPPQFVTETIEAAEQVVRDLGGDPTPVLRRPQTQKVERFIELQSSDVSKYNVGQQVERLGAQRNVSGLVSKLYGSRQCGTAGPGTIVIDSWYGSDMPPDELMESNEVDMEVDREEEVASHSIMNVYLSEEDDAMIAQLMG